MKDINWDYWNKLYKGVLIYGIISLILITSASFIAVLYLFS